MQGRFFTLITAVVVFLIVAFTPIVSLVLEYYGIADIFIHKTVIGLLVLAAGWAFAKALLNKEPEKKEGVLKFKPIFIVAGVVIIAACWYTDLPKILADFTGTTSFFEETTALPVGVRLWTSFLTLIGILLVKFGIYRQAEVFVTNKEKKDKKGKSKIYESINKMNEED